MLAARDQENLVHVHQAAAASKPLNQSVRSLQPKTPGNKYPKTPLKIPLNDENATTMFGGKSGKGMGLENMMTGARKGATFDKNAFVTPILGQQARAPLGMKTTNAKTKAFQTPGPVQDKELEKTIQKQTSARRPRRATHAETVKLEVHGDESPLRERDYEVEYCPPKVKDIPYQSEDFPDGCLNYEAVRPGNLTNGRFSNHHTKLDFKGRTRVERKLEEGYAKSAKDTDERVLKMMEEDWTVGDVPETFRHLRKKEPEQKKANHQIKKADPLPNKPPSTMNLRRAASALSGMPTSTAVPVATKPKPKATIPFLSKSKPPPLPTSNPSTLRNSAALNASRSTLGYSKGRSASGALNKSSIIQDTFTAPPPPPAKRAAGPMKRSVSNMSSASDATITPARFAQKEVEDDEWKRKLAFLSAFDPDHDEDLEPGLRGVVPDSLRRMDDDEEEFVLTLGPGSKE